jgi:N-acetylglucosamine kinase-like BadF-type ATPase
MSSVLDAGVPDAGMRDDLLIAVDGGNSKTDLALLRSDGSLLALVRGPLGSPHHIGLDGTVSLLEGLVADAFHQAGIARADATAARAAHLMLAGLDFPEEELRLHDAVAGLGWAHRIVVGNDTFAVLRAGTDAGWGIAVTCGTGINCVGIGPDGRQVRFPSLGSITGDWGGGYDLGVAALGAAARSQDGRGPATSLEHLVPRHFGLGTPADVAQAIHTDVIQDRRLSELARVVFSEADDDEVAEKLIARLAAEVADFVRATTDRLELGDRVPEVLLGGGLMQAADRRLVRQTADRLAEIGLEVVVRAVSSPPIVGAALLSLDAVEADLVAHDRVRQELESAVAALADGQGSRTRGTAPAQQALPGAGVAGRG